YLNASGTWQTAATNAISATTTLTAANGFVGVGRLGVYAGAVDLDNFAILGAATPPAGVTQSFDTTAAGATPTGWQTWISNTNGTVGASAARALSPANGFAPTGGSAIAARGWATDSLPADTDASVAVYLDSLIPAQVFVRGSNLNTAS